MPHATPCIAFPTEFSDCSERPQMPHGTRIVNIFGLTSRLTSSLIRVILRGNRLACAFVSDSSRPTCVGDNACGACGHLNATRPLLYHHIHVGVPTSVSKGVFVANFT